MQACIVVALLALFNVIESKNVENSKIRRIIEECPNSRPNVVMQSVVLGKKKEKQKDETGGNPDQLLGKLAEMLVEEDRQGGDGQNSLHRLEKIMNRIKSKAYEAYGPGEPKCRYLQGKYDYEPFEDFCRDEYEQEDFDDGFSMRTARYGNEDLDDEYERRLVKYKTPSKVVLRHPRFAERILVKRPKPYKWRKDSVVPCDRRTKDILYIPNSVVSKLQNDLA